MNTSNNKRVFLRRVLISSAFLLFVPPFVWAQNETRPAPNLITDRAEGRTSFQQAGGYDSRYDLKTDVAMIYGVSDDAIKALNEWREKGGSRVAVMTGVAWGGYGEFLDGKFDGVNHWDDAQVNANGDRIQHDPATPYLVPSVAFSNYLEFRLRKVVDAGVDEIYLEEPELWAFAGFSESFQREWKNYYDDEYIRPDATCDAQYRASKLKRYLYLRVIDRVSAGLKEYSLKKYNRPLKIYVATHSLLSYSQIHMVSPESAFLDSPYVDGLIAQIWTGTSRFGNRYNGVDAERTFEIGLLEYGVMQETVRGFDKRVYFLNDPVEDNPRYDWNDYKTNYLCTLTASLMRSDTSFYEVAPWPSRVFCGSFPAGDPQATTIPGDYASTLCLVFQQLRDMKGLDAEWIDASDAGSETAPQPAPTEEIGVLLADSAMYQRAQPTTRDSCGDDLADPNKPTPQEIAMFGDYVGLTTPLIKRGVPVASPVLDNLLRQPGYLDKFKVLILSYDFQKPSSPGIHAVLADWVARGGALIFVDSGKDPYNDAKDWWNASSKSYANPGDHLLASFGLEPGRGNCKKSYGKGWVYVDRKRPAFISRSAENGAEYCRLVADAAKETNAPFDERNYFLKRRGPYLLAAALKESTSDNPLQLKGHFVNLFDPNLEIVESIAIQPGERAWLLDLDRATIEAPAVLASSCRVESQTTSDDGSRVRFETSSPTGIEAISLFKLKARPGSLTINGVESQEFRWDEGTKTLFFKFRPTGQDVIEIL